MRSRKPRANNWVTKAYEKKEMEGPYTGKLEVLEVVRVFRFCFQNLS